MKREYIVSVDYIGETPPGNEELVRCKDCRHWLPMNRFHYDYHPGRGDCELNCWVRDSDWFCADGEMRVKWK